MHCPGIVCAKMQLQTRPTGRALDKQVCSRVPGLARPRVCYTSARVPVASVRHSCSVHRQPLRLVAEAAATQEAPRCVNQLANRRFHVIWLTPKLLRSDQNSKMAVSQIGLVGLAVMGQVRISWRYNLDDGRPSRTHDLYVILLQNLSLNIAEKGFPISVFNRSYEKTEAAVARAQKSGTVQESCSSSKQRGAIGTDGANTSEYLWLQVWVNV